MQYNPTTADDKMMIHHSSNIEQIFLVEYFEVYMNKCPFAKFWVDGLIQLLTEALFISFWTVKISRFRQS